MSNRRKPNPAQAALEAYLLKVRDWCGHLDRGTPMAAIRADMDLGQLENAHLDDDELERAIRDMGRVADRLPRDPGEAATRLLAAMGL